MTKPSLVASQTLTDSQILALWDRAACSGLLYALDAAGDLGLRLDRPVRLSVVVGPRGIVSTHVEPLAEEQDQ